MKNIKKSIIGGLTTLFVTVSPVLGASLDIDNPDMGITNINKLISSGIKFAMIIAALLCFVFLIWGGIQWITSGGDKSNYENARNRITAALIGLAIVAASWAIMTLVGSFLGINILDGELNLPTATGN